MNTHGTKNAYRPEEDFLPPPVSLTVTPPAPEPGKAVTLTATLTNTTGIALRAAVLYLAVDDTGKPSNLGTLAPGRSVTRTWRTRLADDAEGRIVFTAHALFDVHRHGSDCTRASSSVTMPSRSLPGAFDNAGIASDDALTVANIDGSNSSLSAEALASVGLTPGATVTYDGVPFTWPDTRPGSKDNVVSSGQSVLMSGSGSRLSFLGTSTWGEGKGDGKVVYADGTEQAFSVAVPDWYGASSSAAVVLPCRHIATGRDDNPVSLFTFGIDLAAGKELRSLVLPKVSDGLQAGTPALHVFAMTITTTSTPNTTN
ncbi:beta-glucosidase [Streptomyces sp. SID12488]|uniref:beta-glucosidase n=1 Tax=Streptomyces sp. SID12488 TaxID=2706040 RepID=UPI0013DBA54E|nr:beta-glucosidase [Streptomyces sp. SID12488]NEA63259.1 beta-glucosidase [Streptomyces sp. SID12488]